MRLPSMFACAVALALGALVSAKGADPASDPQPQVIAKGLDNPCGVAIQPGTNHVFVSSHAGVLRLIAGPRGYVHSDEIVEFGTDVYGRGPAYEIGPLGLAFLDNDTLVVGGGERLDGEELVRFYSVGATPKPTGHAVKADAMKASAGPIPAGEESLRGEGNFYGIAVKGSTLYVSSNGDDTKGWICRVVMKDGKPGPLTPFIASKQETGVDGPTGLLISPEGKLVGSQFGEVNLPGDALVVIYDPETGVMESKLKTGLNDLAGIAYSPKTKKLYGVDFSWSAPEKGGLFLLEPAGAKMKATRIAQLDHPSALAFAPDGTLYVSVIGIRDESADPKTPAPGTVVTF
jgi:DNA-binding beta-propeller fold protein YncE